MENKASWRYWPEHPPIREGIISGIIEYRRGAESAINKVELSAIPEWWNVHNVFWMPAV